MREIIDGWEKRTGVALSQETRQRFLSYASNIFDAGASFNITGLKTEEEILEKLILGSIDSLCDINVPRGTSFVDVGSGAGIPGLALAIYFKGISGLLVESNNKKADFIRRTANELGLKAVEVIHDRAENVAGHGNFRESFDWCFSRAFGNPFIAVEIGAPFLKPEGFLYIYAGDSGGSLPAETLSHAASLGLETVKAGDRERMKIKKQGILFTKARPSPASFPRNYAAIKRDAERITGSPVPEATDGF